MTSIKSSCRTDISRTQVFAPRIEKSAAPAVARGDRLAGPDPISRAAAEEQADPHARVLAAASGRARRCSTNIDVQRIAPRAAFSCPIPPKRLRHCAPSASGAHRESPNGAGRLRQETHGDDGKDVDYDEGTVRRFASVIIEVETDDGTVSVGEATTSWASSDAGLRLSAELLRPEDSLQWNSLSTPG